MAVFLAPSLKLKRRGPDGQSVEDRIHRFLMANFSGYTAAAGNIFGYWRDEAGRESYGEHREFRVALSEPGKAEALKAFVAEIAAAIHEDCIYMEIARESCLIYPGSTD
jgi:hypothetical protein